MWRARFPLVLFLISCLQPTEIAEAVSVNENGKLTMPYVTQLREKKKFCWTSFIFGDKWRFNISVRKTLKTIKNCMFLLVSVWMEEKVMKWEQNSSSLCFDLLPKRELVQIDLNKTSDGKVEWQLKINKNIGNIQLSWMNLKLEDQIIYSYEP